MNSTRKLKRFNGGAVFLAILTLAGAYSLRAGAIDNTAAADSLLIVPSPELDLGGLALTSGYFLVEPNTMYDFTGTAELEILSIAPPSAPSIAPGTALTTIPDSSESDTVIATPEPAVGLLVTGGLILLVLGAMLRIRRINRP
ncbi:MAG: hypothetical protein ABSB15_15085 [Bryobacteraceae bacterium]|jgi:hypothetical protein